MSANVCNALRRERHDRTEGKDELPEFRVYFLLKVKCMFFNALGSRENH